MIALILLLFLLGIANQRGSTCAVAAMEQLVRMRRGDSLAGFAVAASIAALTMLVVGMPMPNSPLPSVSAVGGGMILAIGARINGRCAMGTVASLSRGNFSRVATILGFFAGALVARFVMLRPEMGEHAIAMHDRLRMGAVALVTFAAAWHFARRQDAPARVWMVVIGIISTLLYALARDWTYTSRLVAIADGMPGNLAVFAAGFFALILGGTAAAWRDGTLSVHATGAVTKWLRAGVGGALMGIGGALVPGGNDTMLLIGVPLLVPDLLLAYATFLLALFLFTLVESRKA